MTHGSLFSGIGGFDLAAEWMGWENKFHCEWNEFGQKVLKYYWPDAESFGDITKSDFKKYNGTVDIISGGFPCQPFSNAGNRKGKEDIRYLWPEMLRAIKEVRPTWVVAENVYGIVNQGKGMVFQQVHTDLENEGYQVQPYILPACSVGAPHKRDRVWFIAYSDSNRKMVQGRNRNCDNEKWNSTKEIQERQNKQFRIEQSGNEDASNTEIKRLEGQWGFAETEGLEREIRSICVNEGNSSDIIADTDTNSDKRFKGWMHQEGQETAERHISPFYAPSDERSSWNNFPTQPPICSRNDGLSTGLDGITVSKFRQESIKAYGNSIVPQVAFQIFKTIQEYEDLKSNIPWCVKN